MPGVSLTCTRLFHMARKKKQNRFEALPSIFLEPGTVDRRTCLACKHLTIDVSYEHDYGFGCCPATYPTVDVVCAKKVFAPLDRGAVESPSDNFRRAVQSAINCADFTPVDTLNEDEVNIYGCERTT